MMCHGPRLLQNLTKYLSPKKYRFTMIWWMLVSWTGVLDGVFMLGC
jgi:hypothetical protein